MRTPCELITAQSTRKYLPCHESGLFQTTDTENLAKRVPVAHTKLARCGLSLRGSAHEPWAPASTAGPPLNPATEDAADVTKALAGAADAASIWIALSLIVHSAPRRNHCPKQKLSEGTQTMDGAGTQFNWRPIGCAPFGFSALMP